MSKVVVILEVTPNSEGKARYLELVAQLRPILANFDGLISMRRFQDLSEQDKLLSLHVWESEEAVAAWRNQVEHRMAQMEARERLFSDYKITVANVVREYTKADRTAAPADSNKHLVR